MSWSVNGILLARPSMCSISYMVHFSTDMSRIISSSNGDTSTHPMTIPTFVQCLYDILNNEDVAIIRWTFDGTAFQILDQKLLAIRILPRYFRHGKYASFQRQLNYFGFRKLSKQKATICTYSQPYFTRDQPNDLSRIKRRVKCETEESYITSTVRVNELHIDHNSSATQSDQIYDIIMHTEDISLDLPDENMVKDESTTWFDIVCSIDWFDPSMDEIPDHVMFDSFLWQTCL